MLRVFVYGTLKPGERNYLRYCTGVAVTAQAATARGRLYALPAGYPAMTTGDGWVHGFVLSFEDESMLSALDELEGYLPDRPQAENEYFRVEVETFAPDGQPLGPAWVYQVAPAEVQRWGGVPLPGGTWQSR
jgi:gamma-glutamylcyclotransferase (GGCT)/AIG2-like uncharacterized protein YtfP